MNLLVVFLVFISSFIPLGLEKMPYVISFFFNFLRLVLWPNIWSIGRMFLVHLRRLYILLL